MARPFTTKEAAELFRQRDGGSTRERRQATMIRALAQELETVKAERNRWRAAYYRALDDLRQLEPPDLHRQTFAAD